jgi:hypothetical protein
MATLTKEQEQGADTAAAVSKKAFRQAQQIGDKEGRLKAEAEQAETNLATIDELGIPHDHYRVANDVRMAEGDIQRWEDYTAAGPLPPPVEVPYDVRFAPKNCPMPECDYVGAPGSCPTHGQT